VRHSDEIPPQILAHHPAKGGGGRGRAPIVGVARVPVGGDHHVPGVLVFLHKGKYVA